ncbi:MAG: FxsA family protein [Verrucomicrobiota bacterium]
MFARLLILFITVPVLELVLFMTLGKSIGIFPTFGIILLTGFLGAWLTRLQGMRALLSYQQALNEGRLPHEEIIDGLIILVAGAVLLTPGFLTDAVGFSLLIPGVRAVVKKHLGKYLKEKIQVVGSDMDMNMGGEQGERDRVFSEAGRNRSQEDVIIEAEVVEEKNVE